MGTGQYDFAGLAIGLLQNARYLVPKWFPAGHLEGQEWVLGDIHGNPGKSFKVNLNTGKWSDFSNPEEYSGGDLISLYAAKEGLSQLEAAKRLAVEQGHALLPPKIETSDVIQPPGNAPIPLMMSNKFGKPSMSWCYRNRAGDPLFYIARYDPVGGKKQIIPWTWSSANKRYVSKGWPTPRPLYGLEFLKGNDTTPIILVEGEKAADCARKLAGSTYIVMTWSNGGSAYDKADFTPIYGHKLLLWPDADEPGLKAMAGVAQLLHFHCPEIKIIDPTDHKDGWDAADAINDGWEKKDFYAWAKKRVVLYQNVEHSITPEIMEPEVPEPVPPDEDNGVVSKSAFVIWEKAQLVTVGENKTPVLNVDNLLRLFNADDRLRNLVWFDEFHQKMFTNGEDGRPRIWGDVDDIGTLLFFQRTLDLKKLTVETVRQAISFWASQNSKNEPRDWMENLKWDGVARIDTFFIDMMGAKDTPYCRAVSRNFWISMPARIYQPGCKADEMIVIEGKQGSFKSSALEIIGGSWYGESKAKPGEKDFYQGLHGKLLLEVGELSSFSKVDINIIKRDLSCAYDDLRLPYERHTKRYPRTCIFAGTTNEESYLNDPTGARRFWPIWTGKIDLDAIREFRGQLFAEGVSRYKAGERWHEVPLEETLRQQERRRITDVWEDLIASYIHGREQVFTDDIWVGCLKGDIAKCDSQVQKRLGQIMRKLGWVKHNRRYSGMQKRVWMPEYLANEEDEDKEIDLGTSQTANEMPF